MILQFKAARNASTPLIAIQTPDQPATVQEIATGLNGDTPAIFTWDATRGVQPVNKEGVDAMASFGPDAAQLVRPDEAMVQAMGMPEDAIIFMMNAHRHIGVGDQYTQAVQAVSNLRDVFKSNARTLVMLAPSIQLPPELETDTLLLDEPLPDEQQLAEIVRDVYTAAEMKSPKPEEMAKIVDALAGLAAFPAEQASAMSLRKGGMDLEALWERKRQMVEQTRGLSVWRGRESFDMLGGLENIKRFNRAVIKGKRAPRVIVFLDEIEKAMSPDGDLSGVDKDQLGMLLSFMQDNNVMGEILLGPAGTGKSQIAKAMGNEAGVPVVALDLGGMKGGIVGESQANIRHGLKVCKAIGGNKLLFIATSNNIATMPAALRRRFTLGTFFMDLPDANERKTIWAIWAKAFKLSPKVMSTLPSDEGWTGAEIRTCCELADSLNMTLVEASEFIVPVARSAAEDVNRLRAEASGRYISASAPGLYEKPSQTLTAATPPPASKRAKIHVQD